MINKGNFRFTNFLSTLATAALISGVVNAQTEQNNATTIEPVVRSVGKLNISIDPRMELLSTVQLLSSNYPMGGGGRVIPYRREIINCFEHFSTHEAVTMTDSLLKYGFVYDAPVIFMMNLSQPPDLEPQRDFSDYLMQTAISRSGGGENLEKYRKDIQQFAEISDFETFWNCKIPYYNQILDLSVNSIGKIDMIKTLEDYFNETQESYNVIIAPAINGGYGPRIPADSGRYNIYGILETRGFKNDIPYLHKSFFLFYVWHEFGHSFVNPAIEKYTERVASLDKMFDPIKEQMQKQAYGNWETVVKEHILRAVHIRLERKHFGLFRARQQLKWELSNGYIYIKPLIKKLKEYEKQRDKNNITFTDFMPELLTTLDDLHTLEYWTQVKINTKSGMTLGFAIRFIIAMNSNSKQSDFDCHCL